MSLQEELRAEGPALAIVAGFGLLATLWLLARPLAMLALAFTIAQALSTVVDVLDRRMPRAAAVALVYAVLVLGLAAIAWVALPGVLSEARSLAERGPQLANQLFATLSRWTGLSAVQLEQSVVASLSHTRAALMQIPVVTISAVFDILLIAFLSLYLLMAGPALRTFTLSLVAPHRRPRAKRLLMRMGHAMGGYIRGAAIDGAIMGTLTWIALTIIGVPYAPVFGLLALLGEFVPYIGPILAALPAIAVALSDSSSQAVTVLITYVVLQQVDSQLIVPNIMRTQTRIHPALVIFALAGGFYVGGVLGAIVAIPLFAALRVLVVYVVAPAIRRRSRRGRLRTAG